MARPEDKTVLVVDDEPDVRLFLQTALEDAGFNVLTAGDGDEALDIVRSKPVDFISLDLVMPKRSGPRFMYEIQRDKELSKIPVLIVTAHAKTESGEKDLQQIMDNAVMSGPGVYLEKPVKPKAYVRHVKEKLGIEVGEEDEEKVDLQETLQDRLRKASPDAIRKALDALEG